MAPLAHAARVIELNLEDEADQLCAVFSTIITTWSGVWRTESRRRTRTTVDCRLGLQTAKLRLLTADCRLLTESAVHLKRLSQLRGDHATPTVAAEQRRSRS